VNVPVRLSGGGQKRRSFGSQWNQLGGLTVLEHIIERGIITGKTPHDRLAGDQRPILSTIRRSRGLLNARRVHDLRPDGDGKG
jgi:hypothetical protein